MRLDHLRYFVAVAEELNFRRAAARLHISQPPLSFHIKALEDAVGIRLINRTTRQVSLTEAGVALLVKARRILGMVEETTEELHDISTGRAGRLRVGFTITTSFHSFFYHSVYSYRRAYPEVRVSFSEMISGKQLESLAVGDLDIGFLRYPFGQPPGMTMTRLTDEAFVLAIHRSHALASGQRISLAKLKDEPFIGYPSSAGGSIGIYQQIFRLCERAGFAPRIVQEALEPSLIIGLVAAGLGVAVVPAGLQRIQIPGVLFKPIADRAARSTLSLVHRANDTNPRLHAFRDLVLRSCVQ